MSIFEGMVRVYASLNEGDVEIAKSRLEEAGLNPVILILRQPRRGGRLIYVPYAPGDDLGGQSFIKVMVPCAEVSRAEEALKILDNGSAESHS